MLKIVNQGVKSFISELTTKELVVFGAGTRMERLKRIIPQMAPLYIVDNNRDLWGKRIKWGNEKEVTIIDVNRLTDLVRINADGKYVFLITMAFYPLEIITQLDKEDAFHDISCYVYNLLADNIEDKSFDFSKGEDKIPKVIHYCWFGRGRMPEKYEIYLDTWKEKCPDYEIKLWSESNYDVTKNKYMYEAYREERFGFVPDYARLDIIYNEGGIYLDVDIELLSDLTDLLKDQMFCCFMNSFSISLGLGFGATKHNGLIGMMRDYYDGCNFINKDGSLNLKPCTEYQDPVLRDFGFDFNNEYQNIHGHVSYPAGLILSRDGSYNQEKKSYTKGIHYGGASWADGNAVKSRQEFKDFIEKRIK